MEQMPYRFAKRLLFEMPIGNVEYFMVASFSRPDGSTSYVLKLAADERYGNDVVLDYFEEQYWLEGDAYEPRSEDELGIDVMREAR